VNASGPVTSGTVTFRRGKDFLGTVSLDSSGTASLSISSLPVGVSRIQAVYNGSPNDQSSVSPILAQTVSALPTVTVILLSSQPKANGQTRYRLVATTTTTGAAIVPSGTVVFRKNGHVIGSAKLKSGTAVLVISRRVAQNGRFVAKFQGSTRFRQSTSEPISPA
jgi:Bacterial Ig-like domain (group 3)